MDPSPLSGQVALVTGGASGIGAATVRLLAAEGATVVALDVDARGLEEVVAQVAARGGRASAKRFDLAQTAAIPDLVEEVIRALGRIDILVNGAGLFGEGGSILELDEKTWDRVQTVNLKAPFRLIQAVGRHMVERG
ncbi:MAG: SDR family NAD(P)-dependent oxidoreductase, partial [Myxococcota bacterium]